MDSNGVLEQGYLLTYISTMKYSIDLKKINSICLSLILRLHYS